MPKEAMPRTITVEVATGEQLVPLSDIASEFGLCSQSIKNWAAKNTGGFPKLVKINKRLFGRRSELDAFKNAQFAAASGKAA